jgi:hypothetical protein
MEHALEHRIRERAYEIWNAHGQATGNADAHWLAAEREVLTSLTARATARDIDTASTTPYKRNRAKAGKASKVARAHS